MTNTSGGTTRSVDRRLGLREGVTLGLGSMIGAGLFAGFAPAAAAAGTLLLVAIVFAALVAAASAHSMVRLAAEHPGAGGVYIYGRARLGLPWGFIAGWAFVIGKTASCAVMAMVVGTHLWPDHPNFVAVLVVLAVLALNLQGLRRPERLARCVVTAVLALTLVFVVIMVLDPPVTADSPPPAPPDSGGVLGLLEAAGFLFFAFAGFARLAPFGDRVRDHRRTIPRAIAISLGTVLALYLLVGFALNDALGPGWVAAREAPLAEAAEISNWPWLGPALRVGGVLLVGGALLTLASGVSHIIRAMARDHHLPTFLGRADGPSQLPRRADAVVAASVLILIALIDLRGAIGYSSFLALSYYTIGNACAFTLDRSLLSKVVPTFGILASVAIAFLLPWESVAAGLITLAFGAFIGWVRWTTREDRAT